MTKVLVDQKELQELFDSIMGNYYQGQDTEQQLIHRLLSNAEESLTVAEPVAVIRFERNKPGNENEMPKVISCNRLPDGDYQVFLAPQPAEPVRVLELLPQLIGNHIGD